MVKQEAGSEASLTQQQLENHARDEATSTGEKDFINSEQPHQQPWERKRPSDSNPTNKIYSCEDCGRTFSQSFQLRRYKRVHIGEEQHSCGLCGKSFTTATTLQTHNDNRVHTGGRPRNRIKTNQKGEQCL